MNLTNRFNIKFKLSLLFLILCISTATLGYIAINLSEQNKQTLKEIHSKAQESLALKDNIITPLYALRELTQSLVMAPNSSLRQEIQKQINNLVEDIQKQVFNLQDDTQQVKKMWQNYKNLIETTTLYLKEGFEEGAYVNITTSSRQQFGLLIDELLKMQSKSLNNATIAYSNTILKSKEIKIEIISAIIFILLLATIIGYLVSKNIITSIEVVQNGLKDFFDFLNNKRKKVKKIKIDSKDEFYEMATSINENILNIQNNIKQNEALIKNATKVLKNIKSGNLGARIEQETKNEALNELKIMMNNMIDNLEYKIQEEIDKRIKQEQLLIQQSKMAAMGEMIGNIAHQWRQPLAQISSIHMNMKVTYDFDNFTKEYLDKKIKEANTLTNYMSQTISDFQNFFKPQGDKEKFSVLKACEEAHFIIESSLNFHGIKLQWEILQDSIVYGYKNEYSQVILNVLSNAKDILIERKIKNPSIKVQIKGGENYAIVKVKDNAGGVKEELLEKIFEPYFTTRHKTQGTGIGLYMAKNIIERNMNGYINVRNEKDGALFTVKIAKE